MPSFVEHTGRQRHAVDHRVQRQSDEQSQPGDAAAGGVLMRVVVIVLVKIGGFAHVIMITTARLPGVAVVVRRKQPNQQKHRHQTDQRTGTHLRRRLKRHGRLGQQMHHRDTDHQSAHAAHQQLRPQMRQTDQLRNLTAGDRRGHDQPAVNHQQRGRWCHRISTRPTAGCPA